MPLYIQLYFRPPLDGMVVIHEVETAEAALDLFVMEKDAHKGRVFYRKDDGIQHLGPGLTITGFNRSFGFVNVCTNTFVSPSHPKPPSITVLPKFVPDTKVTPVLQQLLLESP